MTRIAPVRLMYNPKVLWFDAKDLDIPVDAAVVVSTARGTEFGHLAEAVFEAAPEQLSALKTELKPVIRLANDADAAHAEEAEQLSIAAMPVFRELAAEDVPEMRPIAVEYLLTCDKAIFYFEAENRVDFRELVRKLATRLHVRVDMRQIGSRDEARMMGGLGHCGQELCCKRLGGEFAPVSIRMAKEQNLSLNPQKISGLCGKLMCCLRYEYEAYKDFHGRAPKVGDVVETPDGQAKVVDLDVPREILTLLTADDKKVKVALADMVVPEDGGKPHEVDAAAWEETMASTATGGVFEAAYLLNKFTADSQLGDAKAVHVGSSRSRAASSQGTGKNGKGSASGSGAQGGSGNGGKKSRKKGSGNGGGGSGSQGGQGASASQAATGEGASASRRKRRGEARSVDTGTTSGAAAAPVSAGNRPGQKSSGIRGNQAGQGASQGQGQSQSAKQGKAQAKGGNGNGNGGSAKQQSGSGNGGNGGGSRRSRGSRSNGSGNGGNGNNAGNANAGNAASASAKAASATQATDSGAASSQAKRREPRRRVKIDSTGTAGAGASSSDASQG